MTTSAPWQRVDQCLPPSAVLSWSGEIARIKEHGGQEKWAGSERSTSSGSFMQPDDAHSFNLDSRPLDARVAAFDCWLITRRCARA